MTSPLAAGLRVCCRTLFINHGLQTVEESTPNSRTLVPKHFLIGLKSGRSGTCLLTALSTGCSAKGRVIDDRHVLMQYALELVFRWRGHGLEIYDYTDTVEPAPGL
jgi:hypothetical protein